MGVKDLNVADFFVILTGNETGRFATVLIALGTIMLLGNTFGTPWLGLPVLGVGMILFWKNLADYERFKRKKEAFSQGRPIEAEVWK